jgi:Domain of unknown function (DUF4365)
VRKRGMPTKDDIGNRGEAIFKLRITDPYGPDQEPLFRPYHLGEKFPTLDFLVELVGLPAGRVAYFFAQVKATTQGLTKKPPVRLRIGVSQEDIDRMLIYPGPTYVVGIDSQTERAYIASVNGTAMRRIQGLPVMYPLDAVNMQTLWQEVEAYWRGRDMILRRSKFAI